MADLYETLGEILAVYAHPLVRLAARFELVREIACFVRPEGSTALPRDSRGRAYRHPRFEAAAKEALAPLAEDTAEILRACPIAKGDHHMLNVRADWDENSHFFVEASVSDNLGLFAKRRAYPLGDSLLITPGGLFATLGHDLPQAHVVGLAEAAKAGAHEAFGYVRQHRLVANYAFSAERYDRIGDWLANFPVGETVLEREGDVVWTLKSGVDRKPTLVLGDGMRAKVAQLRRDGLLPGPPDEREEPAAPQPR